MSTIDLRETWGRSAKTEENLANYRKHPIDKGSCELPDPGHTITLEEWKRQQEKKR